MAGNRVTNFLYIFSQLKFISEHGNKLGCVFKNLVVEKEVRWGLFSKYFLKCETCNETFKIENVDNNTSNESDINDAAVKAIKSMERGLDDLEKFMVALDIPFLLPKKYEKHHNVGGVEQQEDPLEITKAKTSRKLSDDDNSSSQKKQKVEEDGNTNLSSELSIKNESLAKDSSEGAVKEEEIFIKEELMEDEESQPSTSFTSQNDATTDNTTLKKEVPVVEVPESILNEANEAIVPKKSKPRYEKASRKAYNAFKQWQGENDFRVVNEVVLLAYFMQLSKKHSPSSLWVYYSMLRTTFNVNENIDIKYFKKLNAFIKNQNIGNKVKKTKLLSDDEFRKFLVEARDEDYLLDKVVAIFGVFGACRCEEIYNLTINDVKQEGSVLIVTIHQTRNCKSRFFTLMSDSAVNPVEIVKKYMDLRPKHTSHEHFFVVYNRGKCSVQRVGIQKISSIPKRIATFLGLPNVKQYTGHCLRRSSATILAKINVTNLKRLK